MASGMPRDSPEWQIFSHARPGHGRHLGHPERPGAQPRHDERASSTSPSGRRSPARRSCKWRKVETLPGRRRATTPAGASRASRGKCWERSSQTETVHHILKGGEDSIGAHEAIQRVYFNIGSCSEECWVNHLTDLRQLDPAQRDFGQTPFDIGQCRRDCPSFRAIEDRLA